YQREVYRAAGEHRGPAGLALVADGGPLEEEAHHHQRQRHGELLLDGQQVERLHGDHEQHGRDPEQVADGSPRPGHAYQAPTSSAYLITPGRTSRSSCAACSSLSRAASSPDGWAAARAGMFSNTVFTIWQSRYSGRAGER